MSLIPAFDSVVGQAPAQPGTTVLEYSAPQDLQLYSVQLLLNGQSEGDSVKIEVVDRDNVYGEGANTIIATLMNKWTLNPTAVLQSLPSFVQNQSITQGIVLRVTYDSTGSGPVDIKLNMQLYSYVA